LPHDRVKNREELIDIIEQRLREETRDVWIEKFWGKGCASYYGYILELFTVF